MPDTYGSFVIGYSVLVLLLFALTGMLLKKVLKLEKDLEAIKNSTK
ncbi:MAG: hypothetical protein JWQ35_1100 [Bacteriovoracaceae bacterium]|nr:hypothetical protein [Bacteriovoracaceae bacterium]